MIEMRICASCERIAFSDNTCKCKFGTYDAIWVYDGLFNALIAYMKQKIFGII